MKLLLIIIYVIAVVLTYIVIRFIIKCACKRDDIDYWRWSTFWVTLYVSVFLPIVGILAALPAYAKLPKIKFPKWL